MIIELFGCPGSGKTYIVNKISNISIISGKQDDGLKGKIKGILKGMTKYLPTSIMLRRKVYKCLKFKSREGIFIYKSLDYYIQKINLLIIVYKCLHKKNIFMDEGVIHRIVSMDVNFNFSDTELCEVIKVYLPYLENAKIFYVNESIDICISNIKKRNRHECDMDEFTESKLKKFIENYKYYFDLLQKEFFECFPDRTFFATYL